MATVSLTRMVMARVPVSLRKSVAVMTAVYVSTGTAPEMEMIPVVESKEIPAGNVSEIDRTLPPVPCEAVKAEVTAGIPYVVAILVGPATATSGFTKMTKVVSSVSPVTSVARIVMV